MSITDVSAKLGEYMLKGWVGKNQFPTLPTYLNSIQILSDEVGSRNGCPVPLMRSPKDHIPPCTFCANCDGEPKGTLRECFRHVTSLTDKIARANSAVPNPLEQPSPSVTHSSVSRSSRSSTPPTDISAAPSSPAFALPVDNSESIRRRQQSDTASAEIGKRLLRGSRVCS